MLVAGQGSRIKGSRTQGRQNMARRGFELTPPSFIVFVISGILALLAVLIFVSHRANIARLMAGTETKIGARAG